MDKPKCLKTNLRNLKQINPNPKDSNQREIKSLEAEKDSDQRERKSWVTWPGLAQPGSRTAWARAARVARSLGSCGLGHAAWARATWVARGLGSRCLCHTRPRLARPGLRAAWVARGLGRARWSEATHFDLDLSFYFWFFYFLSAFFSNVLVFLSDLVLFIRVRNRVLDTRFLCSHVEKYATSEVIRAQKSSLKDSRCQ